MNVHLTSLSSYSASFLKEEVLPTLTDQQKKILLIASIAFSCLVASLLIVRCCCMRAESEDLDSGNDQFKNLPKDLKTLDLESCDQLTDAALKNSPRNLVEEPDLPGCTVQ